VTRSLGGQVLEFDASCNITKQANQFDLALTRPGVKAIVLEPLNYLSLTPQLKRAKAKGIPVLASGAPAQASQPKNPYIVTNMVQPFDQVGWYPPAMVSTVKPGASFAVIGFGVPIPQIQYYIAQFKKNGKKLGLKYLGEVDATADNASAYSAAMAAILAKWPNVQAVLALNDSAALVASAVARANGKSILVTGNNAEPAALQAIKSGRLLMSVTEGYIPIGEQLAWATYDVLTKQHLPLVKTAVGRSVPVTKENVAMVKPMH
jgi:ribose transport system substrate-binding protein